MPHSLLRSSLFFLAISLVGCASPELQQQRKLLIPNYFDCVSDKSKSLDDGISGIGDIAAGAIFACVKYENAAVHQYDAFLEARAKKDLREAAYAIAVRAITDNRKKMATTKKTTNCNMQDLHESCYNIGYAKKTEAACNEFSEFAKNTSSKAISDKSVLMNIQALCYQWCANGINNKPKESPEELCK